MNRNRSILFSQLLVFASPSFFFFNQNNNPNGNDLAKDFSNPKGLIIIHSNIIRNAQLISFFLLFLDFTSLLANKKRYMAFSKLTGVGSECGPDNGLNSLVKHFGQDGSLQQVGFFCIKVARKFFIDMDTA